MTGIGKKIRMERIFDRDSKNSIIVPVYNDISVGQIEETADMSEAVDKVVRRGANAVVLHKSEVPAGHRGGGKDVGLIVRIPSSAEISDAPDGNAIACSVKEAVSLGADAVLIQINLEKGKERKILEEFASIVDQSVEYGMPLLAAVFLGGSEVEKGKEYEAEDVAHCAKAADDLGADIVIVNYTGSPETFRHAVTACRVPVVIAGGPRMDSEKELLEMAEGAVMAGAAGISLGPDVLQRDDLATIIGKMSRIIHKGAHVEDFYPEKEGAGSFWEE